jgi:hypothetical protein
MTTFRRLSEYVDAAREMRCKISRDASYGQVVEALADAGFVGATAGELRTLGRHMRDLTDTRRELTVLIKEATEIMQQHGVRNPEFGTEAFSGIVSAEDIRAQTVIHDLHQFEADVKEAAQKIGKTVPPMGAFDAEPTADNAFAWVYALRAGLLPPSVA